MLIDAETLPDGQRFEADVCVIGAGAAGISLALHLHERGIDVALVESGGLSFDPLTQQLYDGRVEDGDYPALTTSRLRYLGGTTNHWGGVCRPLDAFEFEPHPWVEHSGWPISRAELDPFYERARAILGLPLPHYRFDAAEADAEGDLPLLGDAPTDFEPVVWRRTEPGPARLGSMYTERLRASERIRCVLHANVAELSPGDGLRAVERASAATLGGRKLEFRARHFVLCAGAIENARLLLLSDRLSPGGLGNQHDLVGRFFADHGGHELGEVRILVPDRDVQEEKFLRRGSATDLGDVVGFATTPAFREQHRLLGFSVMGFPAANARVPEGVRELAGAGPAGAASAPGMRLIYVAEKAPNPASRVTLLPELDALGLRKVAVDLNVTAADRESVRTSSRFFGAAVARAGRGRLRLDKHEGDLWTPLAGHQAGTARMADDPKRGVTDRDGRVHGLANLYVTGGALFPTQGWQNPTLTIVALALRLADRLASAVSA